MSKILSKLISEIMVKHYHLLFYWPHEFFEFQATHINYFKIQFFKVKKHTFIGSAANCFQATDNLKVFFTNLTATRFVDNSSSQPFSITGPYQYTRKRKNQYELLCSIIREFELNSFEVYMFMLCGQHLFCWHQSQKCNSIPTKKNTFHF